VSARDFSACYKCLGDLFPCFFKVKQQLLLKKSNINFIYTHLLLKSLFRITQYAASLLDVRLVPVLVPIRTKKRYFIPPAVNLKERTQTDQEAKAKAAGLVVRQQYIERPINISCTGTHVKLSFPTQTL